MRPVLYHHHQSCPGHFPAQLDKMRDPMSVWKELAVLGSVTVQLDVTNPTLSLQHTHTHSLSRALSLSI